MKLQDIQNLIDRFLDAGTTLQEEQLLMEYFQQENIPEELMEYREMFLDYAEMPSTPLQLPRGEELNTLIDSKINAGEYSIRKQPPRIFRYAAAAVVVLTVGIGAFLHFAATPDCVAYVGGEKVTDKTAIEQLINNNVEDMRTDNLAEAQLMDMLKEL